ncbi:MAG: PEP-utilizing enzyme [Chloroflexi bacterium]|nr:PEP-utilizing enzyme [Chloroflexota bacterium]
MSTLKSAQSLGRTHGSPVSPGVTPGPVRFLKHTSELAQVQLGDVIVVPTASPDWTSALPIVGGLVSSIGGPLSALGTIAREQGVPAIFGVADSLSHLLGGSVVGVNGTTGVITMDSANLLIQDQASEEIDWHVDKGEWN